MSYKSDKDNEKGYSDEINKTKNDCVLNATRSGQPERLHRASCVFIQPAEGKL